MAPSRIAQLLKFHGVIQESESILMADLADDKLVDETTNKITDRGQAYIVALSKVPLPEQRWIIPK